MSMIWYFKNVRRDGGLRTGIDIDDETVLEQFIEGPKPEDPGLEWFVDVRCRGESLPTNPEDACGWLLDHVNAIQAGINELAEGLQPGIDDFLVPIVLPDRKIDDEVMMQVRCSAMRRISAVEIAVNLKRTAASLRQEIGALCWSRAELTQAQG